MQDFRKLKVWQKAHAAILAVYASTESFPAAERYGLTSQMRRAASSIAANIAEGCGRSSDADFARPQRAIENTRVRLPSLKHLKQALQRRLTTDTQEIKRMLAALIVKLRAEG